MIYLPVLSSPGSLTIDEANVETGLTTHTISKIEKEPEDDEPALKTSFLVLSS
jgi:DNA-binding XRE family transcriptional regulator